MDNSTSNTISETDTENPLYPLQLHNIANAKTEEELKSAVEQSILGLNKSDEKIALWEHQKAVKEFLSDPTNLEKGNKMAETVGKCANLIAVRNGSKLKGSVLEVDKDSVRDVRESLITQFQAAGIAELMLVDLAITSYFRALNTSRAYGLLLNDGMKPNAPQEQINFYKELGRQVESAHKQFATALTLLKELKQPPIKVKIHTKNAYVAGNQQVNQYGNNDHEQSQQADIKPQVANDLGKKYE